MKRVLLLIVVMFVLVYGCGKEKIMQPANDQNKQMEMEDNDTTSLTPSESFSAVLCQDILNDDTEVDLESYLTDVIYPKISNTSKVTIDRISSSLYLLTYFEGSNEKHLLIQKFYNPQQEEIFFESTETTLNTNKQFLK